MAELRTDSEEKLVERRGRWSEAHERMRIATAMDRILRDQADPDRPTPIVEYWEYLDARAALQSEGAKP